MVGQTNEKGISSSMYKVLRMCEDNKIQSVSFPALGTGKLVHSEIQISKDIWMILKCLMSFRSRKLGCSRSC